jgi:uncharacterized protein DUF982
VKTRRFNRPVAIFVGLGFPREIETVFDAFQALNEWSGARGEAYQVALQSCRDALTDSGDVAHARQMFEAFARDRDILAPDALAASARRHAEDWLLQ